jgi:uncharacterized protein YjcR
MENVKAKRGRKPGKKAEKPKSTPVRKKYQADTKDEAKDLYLRGLTLERIGKYLGVPARTLTNWQTTDKWTEAKDPAAAALELKSQGFNIAKISERLNVSEKTVRNWIKGGKA